MYHLKLMIIHCLKKLNIKKKRDLIHLATIRASVFNETSLDNILHILFKDVHKKNQIKLIDDLHKHYHKKNQIKLINDLHKYHHKHQSKNIKEELHKNFQKRKNIQIINELKRF